MRLTSNTEALSRRSERLPRNGRLNKSILWQGGVVQEWKMISITSSKGSMYKQEKWTKFYWHMCNVYAKRMTQ